MVRLKFCLFFKLGNTWLELRIFGGQITEYLFSAGKIAGEMQSVNLLA
jgi:hypothetical protein